MRFYAATEFKPLLMWSVGFVVCAMGVTALKIWFWMEMEKYSTLRELKRTELRLTLAIEKLERMIRGDVRS
jgi:Family of unknown function (DUF6768)